jgi:hypothetical protein
MGTNLNPDCPCHNFCGDTYLGCCDYVSDCPLACELLLGEKFVAGCVVSSPPPASEPPFSPISPSPETNITTGPTIWPVSQPPPPSECLVTSREEDCEQLLQETGPREDGCTCRNFCNGEEMGCCDFGEPCPPLECTGDFVAGCIVPEEEQTISPQPTPAPTPAPQCYVRVNTQKCKKHALTQVPEPSCDCYNYCDGEYVGCASFDVFESIDCQGELVAGCELETGPQCLVTVNTGECGRLMASIIDDFPHLDNKCSCFDFCGDQYVGCCEYNEFCGFKCAGSVSVAGCTYEDAPTASGARKRNFEATITANGDFYSTGIWPEGFYPYGAADQSYPVFDGSVPAPPPNEEEIIL